MEKKNKNIVWIGIAIVLVVIIGSVVASYNKIASAENDVEANWSQVENVMQRRADLVPNLVSSVKGSMSQEQKVFGDIADARKACNDAGTPKEKVEANDELSSGLSTMVNVIRESYPELASNQNVKTLMSQLEGTENRISTERRRYIQSVNDYNKLIVRFPNSMIAGIFNFEKKDNFQADEDAKEVPKVDFDLESSN